MFIESAFAETDTMAIQETNTEVPAPAPASTESILSSLAPMVLVFAVFYFLLIRPQDKKRRQQEQLISGVKIGEEILTNSGVFGKVTKINDSDNTIIVQIAKDVEVRMLKSTVSDIVSRREKEASKDASKDVEKLPKKKSKSLTKDRKK